MPSVTRTIHFEKTQERYELTASPACVHLDGGGNQTETVTVRLMHYKGKESEEITGKSVTVTDGENSANFTLPAEINQSGSTVISQSLDDREHGAPDSLTVIGILGANNLVIPVVHDGADGENAVTVQISPEAILHKKATTSSQYSLAIRVWNGKTAVPSSGFSAKIQSKPNGLSEYTIASAADSYINYLGISISANTEIYGDITIAVTYNGNTYTKVVPFKTIVNGDPGIKGEKGASLRGPQAWSDLSVGYQFYQGKNSEEYKDIVLYNGNFYSCIKTHVKSATNYPGGTEDTSNGYWKVSENFELIATKVFFAKLAQIDNLEIGDHINIKDKNGVIVLVANKDGLTCKQGTFENITIGSGCVNYGVNRQPFFDSREAQFSESWLEPTLHDNISYPFVIGRSEYIAYLPWDEKANGRRVVIVNEYSDGAGITIIAPTGKCFYEDGLQKTELKIANEVIFLVGYGNAYNSFSGWIVLSRVPINRKYQGAPRHVLYQGKCSNGDRLRYWTFDGSTLTSSRLGQGHYRITFGKSFTSVDDYEVILSSYGMYGHETTQQTYASLGAKTTSYFEVFTADDSSLNDANFLFEVIPATRWHS